MQLGLRIDVDTYRGTRLGVPGLCDVLRQHGVHGTFFFSAGPDNMGRHLFRLLRPTFLFKMLRTRAASLYGWDILLRGTLGPGPLIGQGLAPVIRQAAEDGHEMGVHAWDHHAWQRHVDHWTEAEIEEQLRKAYQVLESITGCPPVCAAAPAWQGTEAVLRVKARMPFQFHSDCRGHSIFLPLIDGQPGQQPQVPNTLPTYDEVIGRQGIDASNYNEFLFSQMKPDGLNVLTIHAEAEGLRTRPLFEAFLAEASRRAITCLSLGQLVASAARPLPAGKLSLESVPGREGWLAVQRAA